MSAVKDMTAEERAELVGKIGDCLLKYDDLKSKVKIKTSRETVCALAAAEMQDEFSITVSGSFGPDMKESVEKFKKELSDSVGSKEGFKVDVKVMLGPGCQYDTIKGIVPIKGGDPIDLVHPEGEVWLVDFWATWCPPCQGPMAHNEEMLKKRDKDWAGKVKIIGISIDQTREAVDKHVEAKDWKRPTHYWRAKSNCSEQYAV
jgi:thiol-disulfide isomerase/thioredoxin